jgi:hypothetical protein
MKIILRSFLFSSLGLLAVLAMACANEAADSASGPSLSTESSPMDRTSPTAIPVSSELIQEHAEAQQSINENWDAFHVDFDRWRSGISACDRAAAETALRLFASDFGDITSQARNLPGKGIARELPNEVISAAASEEASLRGLRDNWNPANTMLLENAQTTRAASADLLRSTQIDVDKLEEMDDPEDRQIAKEFARELAPVEAAWDTFYDSYGALEDEYLELPTGEIVSRLRELVDEHEIVAEALEDIPSDKVTDPVQDPLIEAAESEEEALADLLDAMRRAARAEATTMEDDGEEPADDEAPAEANGGNGAMTGPEEMEERGNGEGGTGSPQGAAHGTPQDSLALGENAGQASPNAQGGVAGALEFHVARATADTYGQQGSPQDSEDSEQNGGEPPDYSDHFDAFDETLDSTRAVRRMAERDLEDLVEGFSENDREVLADFVAAFGNLMDAWDDFHSEFDGWVRTEGECNRAGATSELQLYNQRFSEIGSRVRGLSQVSYLRPSSDLLSEAVEREGAALRSLANTWAPYESDVYRGMDEERANADKLRRLADRRIQELMERNGISLSQ